MTWEKTFIHSKKFSLLFHSNNLEKKICSYSSINQNRIVLFKTVFYQLYKLFILDIWNLFSINKFDKKEIVVHMYCTSLIKSLSWHSIWQQWLHFVLQECAQLYSFIFKKTCVLVYHINATRDRWHIFTFAW